MRDVQMRICGKHANIARGFTLIELMLAMVIGTFLIAGVFTVYINGRAAQDNTEQQSQIIDDARFAIETLSYDLRVAGFWGQASSAGLIAGAQGVTVNAKTVAPDPLPAITDLIAPDCGILWYTDLENSLAASNDSNIFAGTCIDNADYVPLTDILVTKYASPSELPVASLANNVVYIYSNYFKGEIFIGKTAPTNLDAGNTSDNQIASIHRLRTRVYYIDKNTESSDGYPSLHRLDLDVGPKLSNSMLLPGVENLQIQYGIDTNGDGSVNTYVDADPLDTKQITKVLAVQFWVTVRSREQELPAGTTQTIVLAGNTTVHNDGFRRVVMSSVIKLRNREVYATKSGS